MRITFHGSLLYAVHMYTRLLGLGEMRLIASHIPISDNTIVQQSHIGYTPIGILKPSSPYKAPSDCA
jgi:hypothetical protein